MKKHTLPILGLLLLPLLPANGQRVAVNTGLPGLLSGLSVGNGTGVTNLTTELVDLAVTPTYGYAGVDRFGSNYSANAIGSVSTYTTWYGGIGVITNAFDVVRLNVTNWATSKPTIFRAVVRSQDGYYYPGLGVLSGSTNPTTWTILGDSGPVAVALTDNTTTLITLPLLSTVSTSSKLLLQISADGRFMPMAISGLNKDTNGVSWSAYAAAGTTNPTAATATSSGNRWASEFGYSASLTNFDFTAETSAKVAAIANVSASSYRDATISLSSIYATEGDQLNVYFRDVVRARYLPELSLDVTCSVGAQYEDFYRLTSAVVTNITYSMSLTASYETNLLTTWSGSLYVAANTNGQGVSRSVCLIGDSTTAGGQVITELTRRGGTNGFALVGIGTQGSGTNMHEGRSGYKVESFYQGTSVHASPMTNLAGAFDFNYYLTNNSLTLASNDWAIINLGINDVFGATTDAAAYLIITNTARMLTAMVTNIKFAVPGIRVAVAQVIGPASSQDAFGDDYDAGQPLSRYKRNRFMWNEYFGTNGVSGATILPLNYCIDTVNNFPSAAVAVNSRNTNTVVMQNNGVHPDTTGYYQIADAIYAFLKWFEQ